MGSSEGDEVEKMTLKILVDVKSKKVVFAEAGNNFVDFIFSIMTLPLSTVTKLLNDEKDTGGMVVSLGSLYKSIESLGVQYYKPDRNKDSVLKPRLPAAQGFPLLSLNDNTATTITYYACEKLHMNTCTGNPGTHYCSSCVGYSRYSIPRHLTYTPPKINPGYVKGEVPYIVMDNLEVKPMSISLIKSLFNDFDNQLDEQHVQFGHQQGLALLKASLEKQDVLTTVFLGNKK